MMKRWLSIVICLLLLMLNISCDQITKDLVRKSVSENERISLIGKHLTLTKVENSGAFLSIGQEWNDISRNFFLILLPSIILLSGLIFIFKSRKINKWILIGASFVIGGGIGNMIDRILHGSVTDFLHLKIGSFQTGIFNMADVSIMIGMAFLIYTSLVKRRDNSENYST